MAQRFEVARDLYEMHHLHRLHHLWLENAWTGMPNRAFPSLVCIICLVCIISWRATGGDGTELQAWQVSTDKGISGLFETRNRLEPGYFTRSQRMMSSLAVGQHFREVL